MSRSIVASVVLTCGLAPVALSESAVTVPATANKKASMTNCATGTFDVKIAPLPAYNTAEDAKTGRMSIDKTFHGDLAGTSKGEMLTGMTNTKGSAGYVAIERVTGTLNGKSGSFTFQHSGTMNRGVATLTLTVVTDSGTGQLVGLSGKMNIIIVDGKHSYQFDYALRDTPQS